MLCWQDNFDDLGLIPHSSMNACEADLPMGRRDYWLMISVGAVFVSNILSSVIHSCNPS